MRTTTPPLFLLLFVLLSCAPARAQISGIINSYAKVNSITGADLAVGTVTGFNPGDKVLLIQMKGAQIDHTASIAYGDITDYDNAGNYEYAEIASIAGTTISLTIPPCNTYTISGCVQLVSVPVYANETVSGALTAAAWNGSTGGILALEATGTLTLNANLDVRGLGFRGGNFCSAGFSCGDLNWYSTAGAFGCSGGEKGEGIADWTLGEEESRGKLANGGGGSNAGNCGAGGGSNFGPGGVGGDFYSGCGSTTVKGIGGTSLDYSIDRAFLGGGGGGGYRDNGQPTSTGENGGGIILLEAGTLDGMGRNILASGYDVTLITNDEGAGGGGGGGSVILRVANFSSAVNIVVDGGKGGDTENFIFTGNCHGPGGGGGGGVVATDLPLPAIVTWSAAGGLHGSVLHNSFDCGTAPTPHGAADGMPGGLVTGLIPLVVPPIIDLGADTTICDGSTLTLDAGTGFDTYIWSDASNLQTLNINTANTYFVEAMNDCGIAYDTLVLNVAPLPPVDLGADVDFCLGEIVTFDAGAASSWLWQDGTATQTYTASVDGQYIVTITDANNCMNSDTVNVLTYPLPVLELGPEIFICQGTQAVITAESGFSSYNWTSLTQPGVIGLSATLTTSDTDLYFLEVYDINNCPAIDSISVLFYLPEDCETILVIPNAFTPNTDGTNDIFRAVPIGEVRDFQISIFDRWGEQIFQSNDLNLGWDGTFRGVDQEMGTYIYTIEAEILQFGRFETVIRSGSVTLIR